QDADLDAEPGNARDEIRGPVQWVHNPGVKTGSTRPPTLLSNDIMLRKLFANLVDHILLGREVSVANHAARAFLHARVGDAPEVLQQDLSRAEHTGPETILNPDPLSGRGMALSGGTLL